MVRIREWSDPKKGRKPWNQTGAEGGGRAERTHPGWHTPGELCPWRAGRSDQPHLEHSLGPSGAVRGSVATCDWLTFPRQALAADFAFRRSPRSKGRASQSPNTDLVY